MVDAAGRQEWQPAEQLECGKEGPALLILNQPIIEFDIFKRLWQHCKRDNVSSKGSTDCHCHDIAQFKICADGGANRLYDTLAKFGVEGEHDKYVRYALCWQATICSDDVSIVCSSPTKYAAT